MIMRLSLDRISQTFFVVIFFGKSSGYVVFSYLRLNAREPEIIESYKRVTAPC